MAVTVAGKLVTGDGVAIPDVTILFKAVASSNLGGSEVIENTTFTTTTDELGDYSLTVNNGSYSITVTVGSVSTTLGTATIDGDTPSPIDVLELVAYTGVSQTTAQDILDQAVAAKLAAETAQGLAETAQGLAETAQAGAQAAASIRSKAEFEALAQARRNKFAGSGYVVKGTGGDVNGGIQSVTATANKLTLLEETKNINGVYELLQEVNLDLPEAPTVTHADSTNSGLITNGTGLTGTTFQQTITTVVGEVYIIEWIDNGAQNRTEYTATSTSYLVDLTGTDITRVSVIPKSALSRQDVVFMRSRAVDTSVKNIWYPLGNSQYLGADVDGLTGIAAGSFTGFETYSLFGDWQASSALIGKGYIPTNLTAAQQAAFAGNPLNNLYQDGDTIYQEEQKIEVTKGTTDYGSWEAFATEQGFTQDTVDKGLWWDGTDKIIPIVLVTRKHNQGLYHPIYNKGGTKLASDGLKWYNTTVLFNSTIDCFNPTKLTAASGYIGTSTSNPDSKFYDAIYANDIIDLRNSAHKLPNSEVLDTAIRNAISGVKRSDYDGDGELETTAVPVAPYTRWTDGINLASYLQVSTRKSSGEKLHCDLIGDPAFYPKTAIDYTTTGATQTVSVVKGDKVSYAVASGSTGVGTVGNYYVAKVDQASIDLDTQDFSNTTNWIDTGATNTVDWQGAFANGYTGSFTPLIVGDNGEDYIPDGTSKTYKLSHKVSTGALLLPLISGDGGNTWLNPGWSTIGSGNSITSTLNAGTIGLIFYTTLDNYTYPVVNTAVLPDGVGDVVAINKNTITDGNSLLPCLINKVGISTGDGDMAHGEGYVFDSNGKILTTPSHNALTLSSDNPAVKFLPVAVSENGRLCVDLHFKEMKFDVTWGDDSLINIADNVTTTTDDNGNTVLIGTKRIKTEFFA